MENYYATLEEMLKSGRKTEHEEFAGLISSFGKILSAYSKQPFSLEPCQYQTIDELDSMLVDVKYVIRHHEGENLSGLGMTTSDVRQKIPAYSELAIFVKKPEFDNVERMVEDLFRLTAKMREGDALMEEEKEISSYVLGALDAYSMIER